MEISTRHVCPHYVKSLRVGIQPCQCSTERFLHTLVCQRWSFFSVCIKLKMGRRWICRSLHSQPHQWGNRCVRPGFLNEPQSTIWGELIIPDRRPAFQWETDGLGMKHISRTWDSSIEKWRDLKTVITLNRTRSKILKKPKQFDYYKYFTRENEGESPDKQQNKLKMYCLFHRWTTVRADTHTDECFVLQSEDRLCLEKGRGCFWNCC